MTDSPTTVNTPAPAPALEKRGISMHEDIPDWYDCCTCEAEPYWAELEEKQEHATQQCPANANIPHSSGHE